MLQGPYSKASRKNFAILAPVGELMYCSSSNYSTESITSHIKIKQM